MSQTFNQNGHTLWSMWALRSSWPSKKPHFLIVNIELQNIEHQHFS